MLVLILAEVPPPGGATDNCQGLEVLMDVIAYFAVTNGFVVSQVAVLKKFYRDRGLLLCCLCQCKNLLKEIIGGCLFAVSTTAWILMKELDLVSL